MADWIDGAVLGAVGAVFVACVIAIAIQAWRVRSRP